MKVIGGNGKALYLKGFEILPVALSSNLLWHEFGDVTNLSLKLLLGAVVLALYYC